MSHDGSKPSSASKDAERAEGISTPKDSAQEFRSMIFWLTLLGFNIALINEIEWRDSKVVNTALKSTAPALTGMIGDDKSDRR